jgi:hypothetical protein
MMDLYLFEPVALAYYLPAFLRYELAQTDRLHMRGEFVLAALSPTAVLSCVGYAEHISSSQARVIVMFLAWLGNRSQSLQVDCEEAILYWESRMQ